MDYNEIKKLSNEELIDLYDEVIKHIDGLKTYIKVEEESNESDNNE